MIFFPRAIKNVCSGNPVWGSWTMSLAWKQQAKYLQRGKVIKSGRIKNATTLENMRHYMVLYQQQRNLVQKRNH